MARGVPVVSTRLCGIPEAVPDGEAGLLVDPGDVAALADAIALTLRDHEETTRRTLVARRHVARLFDTRRNASELSEIFRLAASRQASVEARRC